MNEIQVWNTFNENISDDAKQNKFRLRIDGNGESLSPELEGKVNDHYEAVKDKVTDNPILFLSEDIKTSDSEIIVPTNIRGFKYTHAFNRNKDFHDLTDELAKYKLLSISTHCHILTKDNKLLFGTKKNQFNQISGFSGFPKVDEDHVVSNGETVLDIYKTIVNRLRPEIGYIVDAVDSINAVGITYVNTPGLRGTDSDYLVRIDETASNAEARFEENSQFQKKLFTVEFEPQKIRDFIEKVHEDKFMSRYALGCIYAETKAEFGEKEAAKTLKTIKKIGGDISIKNETNYFRK